MMSSVIVFRRRVAMLAVAGILMVEAVGNGPWWSAPFRVCLTPFLHNLNSAVPSLGHTHLQISA